MVHYGKLLATLCALDPTSLWGTDAFSVGGSNKQPIGQPSASRSTVELRASVSSDSDVFGASNKSPPVTIQGQTLKTWDMTELSTERVTVSMTGSGGRPLHSNIELWHTPSYVPTHFTLYTEDGLLRPLNVIIETPKHPKTVAVYNTGSMEFPFEASVTPATELESAYSRLSASNEPSTHVQGGQITSFPFDPEVASVQVLLKATERNMKAMIELTQGPNNIKQKFELYASSGYKNPFYAIIETPGAGNVVRIHNQNTVEFPFDAWVLPYQMEEVDMSPVVGGEF